MDNQNQLSGSSHLQHFLQLLKAQEWGRLLLASLIPFIAAALQWVLSPFLPPLTWLFLYPTIFLCAWIGGFLGGLISTIISAGLGIYIFTPPQLSWEVEDARFIHSVYIFLGMGFLFSLVHERFHQSQEKLKHLNELVAQKSQARLQLALESSHAGLWEWNLLTNENEWTDNLWELYGLKPHSCKPSYEAWATTIDPDDKARVVDCVNKAVKTNGEIFVEWQVKNTKRWLMAKGKPEFNGNGVPYLYRGIVVDITDRKQMALELQRWADSFHHCSHGIAISDPFTNCIRYCNQAYASMLGYNETQDVEGLPILRVYAPETHEQVKKKLAEADLIGNIRYESFYQRKDWATFQAQVDLVTVKDKNNQILYRVATVQDINERKQLEKAIVEKERLLTDTQNVAHIGSWMVDLATERIIWSDEHFRLFGLLPENNAAPSIEDFFLLVHPDDRAAMQAWWDDCIAGKQPSGLEFQTSEIAGQCRWIYGCGRLEADAQGKPARMIGTSQDITERKKIENEKNLTEMRYRALVEQAAPDAIYIHDHDGNFIEVNQKACEYDGYTKAELLTMNVLDVESDFDLPGVQAKWNHIEPGATYTLYGHHRRKDGSKFPVEVRFGLLEDNSKRLYIAIVRDITERKEAEAKLLLQSAALETAANAIMITDPAGVIEWVNPAFTQLTGYTKEESIGNDTDHLFKCDIQHPDIHKNVWNTISKGQIWQGEIVYQRKDGPHYTEEQTITPVLDESGAIRHYIAIKQDISLRKQSEVELERYRDRLEQLVDERTRELIAAREQAERLSQVKTAFLANMSHEIRSPMNAMMGFFYLLEQRPLDTEARQLVRKANHAGQSLLGIINDILDFSKIESGHLEIEHIPFRLSDVLDEIAALMSATAGNKNVELIINPCPYLADHLIGDGSKLQQVLVNLTSNAIKFTEQGDVELSISVVEKGKDNRIKLKFAVRDTGIGIAKEKLTEIFTAFTQADSTISRRFGGSGLGLAISRQLVNLMGGMLHVESELGKGSQFWFELTFESDQNFAHRLAKLQHLELLVADDSDTARAAIVRTANGLGWKIDAVESGQAAFSQTLERSGSKMPYDVVLLDWKMPGLDGLATAQAIKTATKPEKNKQHRP